MRGSGKKGPLPTSNEEHKKEVEKKTGFMEKHKWLVYGAISLFVSLFVLCGIAAAVLTLM